MKIELAAEDLSYFDKNGRIEFHDLISELDLIRMRQVIHQELHRRKVERYPNQNNPFSECGRDLALSSPELQSILYRKKIAEAAALLIHKRPLRWAFDQIMSTPVFLEKLEQESFDLAKSLSITGFLIGCAISFSKNREEKMVASVLFFKPSSIIHKEENIQEVTSFFTPSQVENDDENMTHVFGYTGAKPLYIFNPLDPHTHALKKYGYGFGDQIKEKTHPVLFR